MEVLNEFEKREQLDFRLRQATLSDLEAMVLLTQQAVASRLGNEVPTEITNPEDLDDTRKRLSNPETWTMLAEDTETGKLLGLALGYPEEQKEFVGELEGKEHLSLLMIDPSHQKMGIGSLLLDWVNYSLYSKGSKAVFLWTEVDNNLSRPLYEHRGWRLTGAERIHPKYLNHQIQYVLEFPQPAASA